MKGITIHPDIFRPVSYVDAGLRNAHRKVLVMEQHRQPRSVEQGHLSVEDGDVRPQLKDEAQCLEAVVALAKAADDDGAQSSTSKTPPGSNFCSRKPI